MATGLNGSESADFYRDDGGCTIRPAPVFSDEKEDPNRCRHEVFNTLASTILQQHAHQPLIPSETGFILNLVQKMLTGTAPRLFVMMASDIIRWLFFLWASYCYRQQFRLPAPILFISPLVALVEKVGILFQNFQKQDSLRVQCLYEGAVNPGIMHQVINGKVDVLLLAPEMLEKVLQSYKLPRILFACIDNAECVVEFQVYRHTYLRLNKLLEGLGVKYLLGLSALAVDSTAISVKGQFELKESMTIPGCHSPVIPANVQLRVCASCSNKDEQLVELFEDLNPLRLIVICDSGDKIEHVSEMLQRRLSSFSTCTESADATDTRTNENGKRRKSGGHLETSKRCKRIVVVEKYHSMSLSEKKSVSDRFERNEIDVVVTTPALCMGLPKADVIIYYTMPRTYESLMNGIHQVRRQQQGHVHVLLDEQEEDRLEKFRCSTMKIPDSRTIEKQVDEIFEGAFTQADGISEECLGFILGSLESAGHLELPEPISNCRHLKKGYNRPHQLKQICKTLRKGLEKQAKSRVDVYKQLYTDLSSSDNDLENRIARKFIPHEQSAGTSVDEPEQVNTKPRKQKRVTTTTQGSKSSTQPLQQQSLQDSTAAGSQTDGCSQVTTSDMLGEDDLVDIMGYLLTLDKSQLSHLGMVLGLSRHRVKGMKDSDSFSEDMISLWLQQADNVAAKSGVPTWRSLVKALRHKLLGQTGIANEIATEKNLE